MTKAWLLTFGFLLTNLMCLFAIWNNFSNNLNGPKYINSSFDEDKKMEINSLLLQSIGNFIQKIFNLNTISDNIIKANENSFNSINLNRGEIKNKNIFINNNLVYNFLRNVKNDENINKKLKELIFKKLQKKNINKISFIEAQEKSKKNDFTISETSKFSLFFDQQKKNIFILKISNDGEVLNKYDNKAGEVSLYSIPLEKFLENQNIKKNYKKNILNEPGKLKFMNFQINFNNLNQEISKKTIIKKCFTSKFFGRIIGAVSSNDKSNLSIAYQIKKQNKIFYRIRYFHDIIINNCLNENENSKNLNFLKTENIITEKFMNFIESKKESVQINNEENKNLNKFYYEISDFSEENNLENYLNDKVYDDFSLGINKPIKAMAIKKNNLVFTTDSGKFQYTILKRDFSSNLNKISWKVYSQGPLLDTNKYRFFHTNSLKFSEKSSSKDSNKVLFIIQIFTSISEFSQNKKNNLEIFTNGIIRKNYEANLQDLYLSNQNNYIPDSIITQVNKIKSFGFYKVDLYEKIIQENLPRKNFYDFDNDLNLDNCISNIREYIRPTLYSNNNFYKNNQRNSDSFLIEFSKGHLLIMNSNLSVGSINIKRLIPGIKDKIERIFSDEENANIIIKYENKDDLVYLIRENYQNESVDVNSKRNNQNQELEEFEINKNFKLLNLPKSYSNRKQLAFLFEKIKNKSIAINLDEKGILHSVDFTDFRSSLINDSKHFNLLNYKTYSNISSFSIKIILILSICLFFSIILNEENILSNNNQININNAELNNTQNYSNENIRSMSILQEDIDILLNGILEKTKSYIEMNIKNENYLNITNNSFFTKLIEKANKIFVENNINKIFEINEIIEKISDLKKNLYLDSLSDSSNNQSNHYKKDDLSSEYSISTVQSEEGELFTFFSDENVRNQKENLIKIKKYDNIFERSIIKNKTINKIY